MMADTDRDRTERTLPEAVAYLRCSTTAQADSGAGLDAQRQAIERWAQRTGAVVVAWHVDAGVSGAAPVDERPGLLAALDDLRPGRTLVAAKWDRYARDAMAAALVERLAQRAGATLAVAEGGGVGDGPEAILMRRMIQAFAEYERMVIRARTKAALAAKRARGERVGQVPYGWRTTQDGRLEPDPVEQRAIALMRELRAAGCSYRAIAARLQAVLPQAARGARWHHVTVSRVLRAQAQ